MTEKTVLIASLFHPEIIRGGAQEVAYQLFRAASDDPDVRAVLLCSVDGNVHKGVVKSGANITGFDGRDNEFIFVGGEFDFFYQRAMNPLALERFEEFLHEVQPDAVHFHHTLFFGIDLLTLTRRVLPNCRIMFTFHEFISICHANGQMLRVNGGSLCERATPYRCHECFPDVPADEFFMRERWLKANFEVVDTFVAPTEFLRQRYEEWGIPGEKLEVISNGQRDLSAGETKLAPADETPRGKRNKFAFFGQVLDNKGLHVLLDAAAQLVESGTTDFEIHVHGGNAEFATTDYRQRIEGQLERLEELGFSNVTLHGRYERSDLPRHMTSVDWVVVPSTWWEIFGLVVSEAWMFGRPVIASDIGGLGERVEHGKNGLQFPVGDSRALADAMAECIEDEELWPKLSAGCEPPISDVDAWKKHKAFLLDSAG